MRLFKALVVTALLWPAVATLPSRAADPSAPAAPQLSDDGLYIQPWFLVSFLDLRDDLAESAAKGKRLAIVWEQRGCPYCKQMHEVNFAIPEINRYIREHFQVLQLNLFGDREVTDFDGTVLPEKAMARKWGVIGTPTIMFLPQRLGGAAGQPASTVEVTRMRGYLPPYEFLTMFRYVAEADQPKQSFQHYLNGQIAALRQQGKSPPAW